MQSEMEEEGFPDQNSPMPSMTPEEFTLSWHPHDAKLSETMAQAWERKVFLDVTLASGQYTIGAHKLVLCACSTLFETLLTSPALLQNTHPVLYFNDIDYDDLLALVEFMYRGSMSVNRQNFPSIIKAAHILRIRGLSTDMEKPVDSPPESSGGSEPTGPTPAMTATEPGPPKRKRRKEAQHDSSAGQQLHQPPSIAKMDDNNSPADGRNASPVSGGMDSFSTDMSSKQRQLAALLSAMAKTTTTPAGQLLLHGQQSTPTGPSPVMRSRLVWDPAHIVYLERWYLTETRYPTLAQSQLYAQQLSQVPQSDSSGRSRSAMSVTAQNVSHWFQNRRRKQDNHPEIEEKRVKRGQRRATKSSVGDGKASKTSPLDLTRQQQQQQQDNSVNHEPHDSDEESPNNLYIAEQHQHHSSDAESEPPQASMAE